jgi:crossover junction endodeoxyribonuclease RusA
MLNFRLEWPPTVNTYWRSTYKHGGGVKVLLSEKGRKYKESANIELLKQGVKRGITGRVEVLIEAYPPDYRKRDLDNILKPLLDVMEDYGVFENDEQIDVLMVRRRKKGGYVEVHVSEIPEEEALY